jgi:hypothetical protein
MNLKTIIMIIMMTFPVVNAVYVHKIYDWEGDGNDPDYEGKTDPPQEYESCFACHENGIGPGASRICEHCHLIGGLGPFVSSTPAKNVTYTLRDDYDIVMTTFVYQHYYGASVHVPSQIIEGAAVTFSTCFGYDNNTGEGTCHGVSDQRSVDGKFAFHVSASHNQSDPYEFADKDNLPDTADCKYCHMQDNDTIRKAWGNAASPSASCISATNQDCYNCHVVGGVAPQSFHSSIIKLAEGQPETPVADVGGPKPATTLLQEGINQLSSELYRRIVIELDLGDQYIFESHLTLVAPLMMTGKYPRPTDPAVWRAFYRPTEKMYGDVYEIAASSVLEKYAYASALVIARGDLPVDSMAAIAYAKAKGVPILLVKPGELPEVTLEAISKLGPEEIIIVGGPVAVSKAVESKLAAKAKVKRIQGINRCETAVELAKETQPDTIVITDAINPSTDAALLSYLFDAPLLYVNQYEIPQSVRDYLSQHKTAPGGGKIKIVLVGVSSWAAGEIREMMTA